MSNTASPTADPAAALWEKGIGNEVEFWRNWVQTAGGEWSSDFENRLRGTGIFQFRHILEPLALKVAKVLDVGAGPVTMLGPVWPGVDLEIVPVDPLADEYDRLLNEGGVKAPIHTRQGAAETLDLMFDADSFDVVHCNNALDHSLDAIVGVAQMLRVVKIGHPVLLSHNNNEAVNENYVGFHQWNFEAVDKGFFIWNRTKRVNMNELFRGCAEVEILSSDDRAQTVAFWKRAEPPEVLLQTVADRAALGTKTVTQTYIAELEAKLDEARAAGFAHAQTGHGLSDELAKLSSYCQELVTYRDHLVAENAYLRQQGETSDRLRADAEAAAEDARAKVEAADAQQAAAAATAAAAKLAASEGVALGDRSAPRLQVIRMVPRAGFAMVQQALESVGRHGVIENLHSMDEVRAAERPLHVIPASGVWNFLPHGDSPGALAMLDDAFEVYGSFDGITVIFDCTGEGFRFDEATHRAIADRLTTYKIDRERAVMLTSRLFPDKAYLDWCVAVGQQPMLTMLSSPVQLYLYAGTYRRAADDDYIRRQLSKHWPFGAPIRPKKFLTLNNMPREARWALMATLVEADLLDHGHVSFQGAPALEAAGETILSAEAVISELLSLKVPAHVAERVRDVMAHGPYLLDEPPKGRFDMAYDIADAPYWGEAYFAILTESDFPGHAGPRFSEKTLKPIANLLPFILIAPQGVLAEMRRLGFQTFGDVIDESYDDLADPGERLNAALAEAVRLASLSLEELRALYVKVWPRLTHNFINFLALTPELVDFDQAYRFLSAPSRLPEHDQTLWASLEGSWLSKGAAIDVGADAVKTLPIPDTAWEYGAYTVPLPAPRETQLVALKARAQGSIAGVSLISEDGSALLTSEAVLKPEDGELQLYFERRPQDGVSRILFRNYDCEGRGGLVRMRDLATAGANALPPLSKVHRRLSGS